MFKISTLNKISPKGLVLFGDNYEMIDEVNDSDAVLVRSQNMHDMDLSFDIFAIARAGAGINNIPIEDCSEKGIVVFNTPGANANAVKELVLTGLLMSARNVSNAIEWTKTLTEDISKTVEKNKSKFAGEEIKGKTLGVIGLGAIGVLVANAAEDLGMKVLGYDPYISVANAHDLSSSVKIYESLDAILPKCDYITIHVPAMEDTTEMFNDERFAMMKDGVVLLNFSRDKLVKNEDIIRSLKEGKIRKYVTDFPTDDFIGVEDAISIPHLGASTKESEENCAIMAVEQVMDYLENGNITNSVNYPECNLGAPQAKARICVLNKNVPAMLGNLTGILADMNINISDLINRSKGDYACTLIDVDSDIDEDEIIKAFDFEGIIYVRVIHNT